MPLTTCTELGKLEQCVHSALLLERQCQAAMPYSAAFHVSHPTVNLTSDHTHHFIKHKPHWLAVFDFSVHFGNFLKNRQFFLHFLHFCTSWDKAVNKSLEKQEEVNQKSQKWSTRRNCIKSHQTKWTEKLWERGERRGRWTASVRCVL